MTIRTLHNLSILQYIAQNFKIVFAGTIGNVVSIVVVVTRCEAVSRIDEFGDSMVRSNKRTIATEDVMVEVVSADDVNHHRGVLLSLLSGYIITLFKREVKLRNGKRKWPGQKFNITFTQKRRVITHPPPAGPQEP